MTVLEQSSPMQATNPAGVGSHSKKDEAMQRKDKDHDRKEKHCNDGNVLEAKRSITIENNIEVSHSQSAKWGISPQPLLARKESRSI